MSVVVLVDGWNPSPWVRALQSALPDALIEVHGRVKDPELVRYALLWRPPAGSLELYPNLEVLFSLGAGVDHLMDYPGLPPIPIARIVDADLTARMREWVVLQVLLHHRQHLNYSRFQRQAEWRELPQPAACDVRVGVMGLGTLGSDCADHLKAIGFQVFGWSRTPRQIDGIETFAGVEALPRFLQKTDILVCLLPLTPQTKGLINRETLAHLAQDGALGGPVFINAGRGGVHVETDLVAALKAGVLKGASLDVFEIEPLAVHSPLWTMENVIITPHVSAVSDPNALAKLIGAQIQTHWAGEPLQYLVDQNRGY